MSLKRLLGGERPSSSAGISATNDTDRTHRAESRDSKESRLARANNAIDQLPAIIENDGNRARFRKLLASAYCFRAFLADSVSDADQSILIYRSLLAIPDLPEFDRVESLLGLARACLCKAYLVPAEREKMEVAASAILQQMTNDSGLDPVLRNIAAEFSMKWKTLKDQGEPQAVVDWLDWMEQLRQWETDHAEK
jgi:hypothetical protein